ncbi:MAG: glycoside hydrolase family 88 protein [Tannerellaceae bacterium]|jgi:rhamnogalacturonyl hydrolase YesR|nr:glycoside hydrolase family 88 protein [Tannerellaceae bacterium]
MKKISLIKSLFFCLLITACTPAKEKPLSEVIEEALAAAGQQSLRMAQQLAGQDSVLPRSFINGEMVVSNSGWWCSGFFPGVLWYLYENNPTPELLAYARQYTARILPEQYNTHTHDLGFMLYCSFGNGYRLTGDTAYRNVLLTGAKSLSTRYNPAIGLIRSWDNTNGGKWQYPVIIDNMMNLELLFYASRESGDPRYHAISISHAGKTKEQHFRSDFSSFHVVSYDTITGAPHVKQTHQGFSAGSSWARGQAWGLYGYTMAYRETKDPSYLEQARHIAHFLLSHPHMPDDYIPYWDFDAPDIPDELRDASAGAIICSALIELSGYVNEALSGEYLAVVEKQLRTLASPEYTAEVGENGNFILRHSVGHLPGNSEVDVPLTYADYYYVEALMRYKKRLTE